MVTHLAAGTKGMGFNSPVTGAVLTFNTKASTPVVKQCWPWAARLQQTNRICSVVDTSGLTQAADICGLVLRPQT